MDFVTSQNRIRNAAITAFLHGAVIIYFLMNIPELEEYQAMEYINGVLMICGSIGLLRKSRTMAILLFSYLVISKLYLIIFQGLSSGLGVPLIIGYFYYMGIRGTFDYHKIMKESYPDYRVKLRWPGYLFLTAMSALILMFGMGILVETGFLPGDNLFTSETIPGRFKNILLEEGILDKNEQLEMFYTDSMVSIKDNGIVFTDRRVINYQSLDGTILINSAEYNDIESIVMQRKGDEMNPSQFQLNLKSGSGFLFFLPAYRKGDEIGAAFIEAKLSTYQ